jgi:hypothetical protein
VGELTERRPLCGIRAQLQIPSLGMTNWRAVAHLGMGGGGWTDSTNQDLHTYPNERGGLIRVAAISSGVEKIWSAP